MITGIMNVNKPSGMTSHDVVHVIRRRFRMRQVGHAGTLDPLATGVLILLLGKATKLFGTFSSFDKAYQATLTLGIRTTTADIQGRILERLPYAHVTRDQVQGVLRKFVGEIEQVPPMVSAVKFQGRRLYQLARNGLEVPRQARRVKIDSLNLEDFSLPTIRLFVECSKGTYIRKLGEDIGQLLGCGACISEIQRTRVGPFGIETSVSLESINESHIRDWQG